MTFTDEQLNKISQYADLLMTPAEIAILLDLNIQDFIWEITEDTNSEGYKCFQKSFLNKKLKIRKQLFDNTENSEASLNEATKLIDEFNSLIYIENERLSNK